MTKLEEVYTFLETRFKATQAMANKGNDANDGQRYQKNIAVKNHVKILAQTNVMVTKLKKLMLIIMLLQIIQMRNASIAIIKTTLINVVKFWS